MTRTTRQRLVAVVLGLVLCLAACVQPATPAPTPPPTAPATATSRPTATPTATPLPLPTITPTLEPSPTPVLELALSVAELPALLDALPWNDLAWEPLGQVGALQRFEAASADGALALVATVRGSELACLETRLLPTSIDEADVLAVLQTISGQALPQWTERADWLTEALQAVMTGGEGRSTMANGRVRATLRRNAGAEQPLVLVLSTLRCAGEPPPGELEPFDPTLSLGLSRQAVQWAFEGLAVEGRFTFVRQDERMGQPVVVGTSRDSLATLTLVGPQDQLVFANLSLAVPLGSAQAESSAVALSQLLTRLALPAWQEGEPWMAAAVRSALRGGVSEQRRSGLRLLVRRDPASDRLVDVTLTALRATLPPLPSMPPAPVVTTVTITGLPPEAQSCLTVVFLRGEQEVARLPVLPDGRVQGPEADETLLEGDLSGQCPWADYWTPSSRLPVSDGEVTFAFAPVE